MQQTSVHIEPQDQGFKGCNYKLATREDGTAEISENKSNFCSLRHF